MLYFQSVMLNYSMLLFTIQRRKKISATTRSITPIVQNNVPRLPKPIKNKTTPTIRKTKARPSRLPCSALLVVDATEWFEAMWVMVAACFRICFDALLANKCVACSTRILFGATGLDAITACCKGGAEETSVGAVHLSAV